LNKQERKNRDNPDVVVFGKATRFNGVLKFETTLLIQGKFKGTIEATGTLIVDKDAVVEADSITVSSLTVFGTVSGAIFADDKVDMMSGSVVRGNLKAARLRIADGVIFEGRCNMTSAGKEVEIFSRPIEEIKADFQRVSERN